MFDKVLIANRGEIACRIIRTCRRMGIKTVGICAADEGSPLHAELADELVVLPAASSLVASYLDIAEIVGAARQSGADAIHPGYGFLSENPALARSCAEAGITFVGPSPEIIRLMGNKRDARDRLAGAGVPVLPGTSETLDGNADLGERTESIGYPLMVKASEGGGGIGMRLVSDPSQLGRSIARTRSSAGRAFGSEDVYLERFIPDARHIEVQIIGSADGVCTHLWERECSVQRRHQKVIEEAPSPSISDASRERMTAAALLAARDVGYTNVGTFEFIVDQEEQFYFLEANTRLQVEHGTTEMVTGIDIVEQQLKVAAGMEVATTPPPVRGHAIQCRVYAEDPQTFIPSPGTLREFEIPTGDNLRVDTGFRAGDEVSSHFDPLLAKVIAWGETRNDAVSRMSDALAATRISGVKTNIPMLRSAISHPAFVRGWYTTGLLQAVV